MYYLNDTKQSEYLYILKAYTTAISVALFIAYPMYFLFPDAETPDIQMSSLGNLISVVLLGPFLETLLMIPIFAFIKMFINKTKWIAFVSAAIWAGFHSLSVPIWGLGVFFTFYILSLSFLTWEKISKKKAIFVTFGVHASINATVFIISAIEMRYFK